MRRLWWLLFAAAFVLKASYLVRYVELPFLYGPLFDAPVYLAQADAVRSGQFGDPTLLAFSPLYGYLLALFRANAGLTVLAQLSLGALNLLVIARITARWFGELAGYLSAALYLGYGVLMFYETKLMSETLGISLLLLAMLGFTSQRFTAAHWLTCLGSGIALGLATLARASLLPSLPFFALCALLSRGPDDRLQGLPRRGARAALLSVGLALMLGGSGLWTLRHSGIFVPVILISDTAAQASRAGEWKGDLTVFAKTGNDVSAWNVVNQARATLAQVARGQPPPSSSDMVTSIDVAGYLRSAPGKALLTLSDTETSFDYGYYGERSEVAPLRFASVSFGLLLCLALVGLWIAFRERLAAPLGSLIPIVLGVFLTTTLFHPSTRYRLPLTVAMLPLAGYALSRVGQLEPPKLRWPVLGLVGLLSFYFVGHTLHYRLVSPAMWQLRVAEAAAVAGDPIDAEQRIARALALAPDDDGVRRRVTYVESLMGKAPSPPSRRPDHP